MCPSDGGLPRFHQPQRFSGPGCPPVRRLLDRDFKLVDHQGNYVGQVTGDRCHGEGNDHDGQHRGSGGTIGSGVAVPPTVLVTETDTGALIVQGRPEGPRVYLSLGEAAALRRELATAFESAPQRPGDGRGGLR